MKNFINILDDLTINKIAAGEVVERPSSVVKELVENCVDAESTKITIDIQDGGKKLIRITDNGIGIPSSEVEKSFLRHATSKIKEIDDLYDLYSLGFRGEALASISSVSRLEMITKTKDEMVGTKVIVEGGKVISKEPVGCTNGTTLIIKDMFFNTPVRQKFLKSTHAETINISDLINKLAIGNPKIQFKYVNNNKSMLNTPGDGRLLSAIRSIYGKDITENLVEIEYEGKFFKLCGYIGNNNVYRSNKNLQHIYINNRFVKSKVILDSISEAYKGLIPINKHAVCFLDLEINPSTIDVNIHPTKLEIKFENEQQIYIELRDYLRKKLIASQLIGKYETYDSKELKKNSIIPIKNNSYSEQSQDYVNKSHISKDTTRDNDIEIVELNNENVNNSFMSMSQALDAENKKKINSDEELIIDYKIKNIDNYSIDNYLQRANNSDVNYINESVDNGYNNKFNENHRNKEKEIVLIKDEKSGEFLISGNLDTDCSLSIGDIEELDSTDILDNTNENIQEEFFSDSNQSTTDTFILTSYRVAGSIFNTYIVLEKGNSMYLLDQHAAHERVLYERYMDKFYKQSINMQMLLDPIVLELSSVDMLQVENNIELFVKFGFEIEIFGNNHIMIRSVPTTFGVPESEKFILQIIDSIDDIKNNYELKGEKFASMACRAAIKANDKIENIEVNSLLSQIEECKNPFTCPHGRPILVEISKKEIEKMFKRIM